jgi:LacI family transcriptional regulator
MVGLIIPDLMHSFFAEVAKGIARKFEPLGYQIVISNSEENPDAELREIEVLLDRSVDGIIIAAAQPNVRGELFKTLQSRKIPYVLIDRLPAGFEGHFVGVKDEEIGMMATEHLIEQGCRRIAHLRGPANSTGIERLRGYRRALAKHQLQASLEYNDPVAAGALKAILEAGLKVPDDIAVIGAGNVHYSDLLRVPLSTIDQSSSLIGETAAHLLVECIEAKKPVSTRRILIPPRLIVRESSQRK